MRRTCAVLWNAMFIGVVAAAVAGCGGGAAGTGGSDPPAPTAGGSLLDTLPGSPSGQTASAVTAPSTLDDPPPGGPAALVVDDPRVPTPNPEPSTWMLIGTGAAALVYLRRFMKGR